jgi:hypothetical protein
MSSSFFSSEAKGFYVGVDCLQLESAVAEIVGNDVPFQGPAGMVSCSPSSSDQSYENTRFISGRD